MPRFKDVGEDVATDLDGGRLGAGTHCGRAQRIGVHPLDVVAEQDGSAGGAELPSDQLQARTCIFLLALPR